MEYIEAELSDIELANRLISEVLGRCLDELAPQTRNLLKLTHQMVSQISKDTGANFDEIRFTRKMVRSYTRWSDSQLKNHMKRLEDLEYLLVLNGGRGNQIVYEKAGNLPK